MRYLRTLGLAAAALGAMPLAWSAQWAQTARDVNLRAGPAVEYPIVARVRAGVSISVVGCLSDYHWCDVEVGPSRGWVYAGNIVYPYQGAYVPVLDYGALIGIGIVAFTLGNYWDDHYRGRPWYPQRELWIERPMPRHGYGPGFGPGRPHAPPPGFRPDGGSRSPEPGFGPGGRRPPHGVEPGSGGRLPPHDARPGSRGPQGAGPGDEGRRPHNAGPGGGGRDGGRPPQGGRPGVGERPPHGAGPGGGGRPSDGQGPAGALRP